MLASIVYWVGVILAIYAVYEIFTKKPATELWIKVVVAVLVLCTSWIGMVAYFLFLRNKLK
ncbi:MAG: PLDc N-terminal domain-containing protein [Alistipes sp.]|jgi:hypothetical protein|nr:PLDc N-terminal domain-containing protein [Alistipes sp.]